MPSNKPPALKFRNLQYDEDDWKRGTRFNICKGTVRIPNRPVGIETKYRIFTAGNRKHRAAVVIPNNKIDAMLITQISNEHRVFLEIKHENLKFFAACMYFDIEDQIENKFKK